MNNYFQKPRDNNNNFLFPGYIYTFSVVIKYKWPCSSLVNKLFLLYFHPKYMHCVVMSSRNARFIKVKIKLDLPIDEY